jgi:hypothetical protein
VRPRLEHESNECERLALFAAGSTKAIERSAAWKKLLLAW